MFQSINKVLDVFYDVVKLVMKSRSASVMCEWGNKLGTFMIQMGLTIVCRIVKCFYYMEI